MNKNSNTYTFLYAAVLVIVVAATLSVTSIWLKKPQEQNITTEKKLNILLSVGKGTVTDAVDDKDAYINTQYDTYIVESFIVNGNGERMSGNAFEINMKAAYEEIKAVQQAADNEQPTLRANLNLPIFVCQDDDGCLKYILPIYGAGLWGAIWGYVALNDDFNTIYGAVFAHKGETPGLGAEIATEAFAQQFIGKKIFEENTFTSVKVMKGGAAKGNLHGVDAISGGTITSQGVEKMLYDCLNAYKAFLEISKR
ncbi:MAG: NADH:ubiquinone reductase (Na(+)-transporting) subunit C [Prevotellaceae bacterium]|nr:NADH:ubiquinone reductase (Na(+)-transporting) subunit C [Prevotellaceae bacterium]